MTATATQFDLDARIDEALAEPDPVRSNQLVTTTHHELGLALREVIGDDGGANFHAWAVWGSREAGRTIARRDLPGLRLASTATALAVGYLVFGLVGALAGAAVVFTVVTAGLVRSSREILAGNRTVLDDIGRATALFVAAFAGADAPDEGHFDMYAATLRRGRTEDGGQELLRRAFACYYAARFETDLDRKHELVFAGNCFAVWHEHIRLQRHIAGSMLAPLRWLITRWLLDFHVGPEHLWVARDLSGGYPETLVELSEPEAVVADRALRSGRSASGARSWACLEERMAYVVELFRTRHTVPTVFDAPYP